MKQDVLPSNLFAVLSLTDSRDDVRHRSSSSSDLAAKNCPRGLPSMTSALKGGRGGSGKVDNSTDKLCDHVCDRGVWGGGVQKSEIFVDVIDESPLDR